MPSVHAASGSKNLRRRVVTPLARTLTTVLGYFSNVKARSNPAELSACCPSHETEHSHPSCGLRIVDAGLGRQRLLVCCYKGCAGTEILEALGLASWDQLTFPKSNIPSLPARKPTTSTTAAPPSPAALAEIAADVERTHGALMAGFSGAAARAYLEGVRLIPRPIHVRLQLGLDGWGHGENVTIPYFRQGRAEVQKHRLLSGKEFWRTPSGAAQFLYLVDSLAPHGVAALVEGEFDALSLLAVGWPHAVVSLPNGVRTATAAVLQPLLNQRRVFVATDADTEGEAAAERTIAILGAGRCRRLKFGKHKDANDALRAMGPVRFRQLLDKGTA